MDNSFLDSIFKQDFACNIEDIPSEYLDTCPTFEPVSGCQTEQPKSDPARTQADHEANQRHLPQLHAFQQLKSTPLHPMQAISAQPQQASTFCCDLPDSSIIGQRIQCVAGKPRRAMDTCTTKLEQPSSLFSFKPVFDRSETTKHHIWDSGIIPIDSPPRQRPQQRSKQIPGPAGCLPELSDISEVERMESNLTQMIANNFVESNQVLMEDSRGWTDAKLAECSACLHRAHGILSEKLPGALLPSVKFVKKKARVAIDQSIPLLCLVISDVTEFPGCDSVQLTLTDGVDEIKATVTASLSSILSQYDMSQTSVALILLQVQMFYLDSTCPSLYMMVSEDNLMALCTATDHHQYIVDERNDWQQLKRNLQDYCTNVITACPPLADKRQRIHGIEQDMEPMVCNDDDDMVDIMLLEHMSQTPAYDK